MIITSKQMASFSNYNYEEIVISTIAFLKNNYPTWTQENPDRVLREFILLMEDFCKKYQILEEENFQKMITLKMEFDFDFDLSEKDEADLLNFEFDEAARIEKFHQCLLNNYIF